MCKGRAFALVIAAGVMVASLLVGRAALSELHLYTTRSRFAFTVPWA
ncbi:MAG: hypothetical protein ACE5MB_06345 [Anaerolineae bacterium]